MVGKKVEEAFSPNAIEVILRVISDPNHYGNEKKKKRSQDLSNAIVKRVPPGTLVVQQKQSGDFKLIVFKETKNFFIRLNGIFSTSYEEKNISIKVDDHVHDLSGISSKYLSMPIKMDRKRLMVKTTNLLREFDEAATSSKVQKNIDELKLSLKILARDVLKRDVDAHIFGSRRTGLAKEGDDVDIYLDVDDSFNGRSISDDILIQSGLVKSFGEEMKRQEAKFENIVELLDTVVPIVKFKHKPTGLKCDLSFRSGMGTMNSLLVKLYLDLDPRVKFVVTGVKCWMQENELADKNTFSSYAQIWLALFFLMQKDIGVIPSLQEMRNLAPSQKVRVEGWDCSIPSVERVNSKWNKSKCKLTREELLDEFFAFYSQVPLERVLLSTLRGSVEKRKNFSKKKTYRRFFEKYAAEHGPEALQKLRAKRNVDFDGFCLQDPLDLLKNITKKFTRQESRKCAEFIQYCREIASSE